AVELELGDAIEDHPVQARQLFSRAQFGVWGNVCRRRRLAGLHHGPDCPPRTLTGIGGSFDGHMLMVPIDRCAQSPLWLPERTLNVPNPPVGGIRTLETPSTIAPDGPSRSAASSSAIPASSPSAT